MRGWLTGVLTAAIVLAVLPGAAAATEVSGLEQIVEILTAVHPVTVTLHPLSAGGETQVLELTPGDTLTLPGEHLRQDSRVLDHWRSAGADFLPGETITVTADLALYPVWRTARTVEVTFLSDDGEQRRTLREGDVLTAVEPAADRADQSFVGWLDADGRIVLPEGQTVWADTVFTAAYAPALNREHVVYIHGQADRMFAPDSPMTRAEAAAILFRLLPETERTSPDLPDVPAGAWYGDAARELAALGAILPDDGGSFRPEERITRAEFLYALVRFFPVTAADSRFSDVNDDHWAVAAVNYAAAQGWTDGYGDGTFRPDDPITRAEAVSLINRVLGRTGDRDVKSYPILRFFDLPATHWAYPAVMEAATVHTPESTDAGEHWTEYEVSPLAPGLHYVDGELRYVDPATRWFACDTTVDGFQFDALGRYTCGDAEVDGYVKAVLAEITDDTMSREQMLHAAYNYTRDSFTYLRRNYYQIGDTGWELENARVMFQTGLGNCYCYTAVFYYLSRQLGYDSTAISGVVGTTRSPHGWVEIDFNDVTYIFDTELEMAYRKKGVDIYDFYMMSYSRIPWPYVK